MCDGSARLDWRTDCSSPSGTPNSQASTRTGIAYRGIASKIRPVARWHYRDAGSEAPVARMQPKQHFLRQPTTSARCSCRCKPAANFVGHVFVVRNAQLHGRLHIQSPPETVFSSTTWSRCQPTIECGSPGPETAVKPPELHTSGSRAQRQPVVQPPGALDRLLSSAMFLLPISEGILRLTQLALQSIRFVADDLRSTACSAAQPCSSNGDSAW